MFYAGTIPDGIQKGELDNARMIASARGFQFAKRFRCRGEQIQSLLASGL